jgi:hypothetical protein
MAEYSEPSELALIRLERPGGGALPELKTFLA